MEAYPPELTSPPLPLVALIGAPELLPPIADYLRTQHAPRLNALGIPDAHSAAGAFGARKAAPASGPPAGILKAGWLRKHRSSRPSVAALLVDRDSVTGDPSAWAWLVTQLDAVKAAARPRGARVVVIIVQAAGGAGEVPEDRCAMICRQAGVERRCVITYTPSEGLPALQVLGRVLHEQACLFYVADAQRRLTAHVGRNVPNADLNLRTAFKMGALAEFRADWGVALRLYREAYAYLPQLLAAVGVGAQRFAEVRAVAEQVHVKITSLLLLALKQVPEALAQYEAHTRLLRCVPFEAPPGLLASHQAWLCRQHCVMAELLLSSGEALEGLKREQQPGALYLAAARAAIERRRVAAFISGMHGGGAPPSPGAVQPGPYVGQVLLLTADSAAAAVAATGVAAAAAAAGLPVTGAMAAAGATRRLSEEQFELHLEAEETGVQHSKATVDLLRTAQDALARSGRRTGKTLQHARLLLGRELLEAGDAAGAERLLTEVAAFYRRERWEGPLASALLLLRECRQHTHDLRAHTELSLEVSALGGAALDAEQRAAMATAAVAVLALPPEPTPALASSGSDAAGAPIEQQQQQQGLQGGMAYTVAGPDSPWLSVLPLSAGFFDPLRPAAAGAAGATGSRGTGKGSGAVRFAAAVWSNAPIELPLAGAEVQLVDARGSFAASLLPDAGKQAGAAGVLALPPGAWLRLVATIPVRCSGQLEALAVVLRFGDCSASTLAYQLPALLPGQPQAPSSPRAGQTAAPGPAPAVGWLRGGWTSMQPPFSVAAGFLPGHCTVTVPPQHAPPLLVLEADGFLQGEQVPVNVTVAVGRHSIRGAVLTARALHLDSQQQLGLVPADSGHQPAPQQPPADASGGGCSLVLGDIGAAQRSTTVLLMDARYAGNVELAAELQYTADSHDPGTSPSPSSQPEDGRCSVTLAAKVSVPWRLGLQLLGPPATHTLLAAAPGAGGTSTADAAALLAEQTRRLQSLSIGDGAAAAAAAPDLGAGGEGGRDLGLQLLRGLPRRLVLPAGQRCTALVQLQSQAACQLDVLAVELEGAAGVSAVPAVQGADPSAAGPLSKSDVFTAAFSLASTEAGAADLPSLGFLRLRWRRHERRRPVLTAAARGGSQLAASDAKAAVSALELAGDTDGAGGTSESGGAGAAAPAAPACELLLPLPAVSLLQPLLTAEARHPPAATAGSPVELQLVLRNGGSGCQQVAVAVGDPHGCLLAGPKSTSVELLPHSSSSVTWQATPYHTGLLRLPEVTASLAGQAAEVTRGCTMFVERPPEQQEGLI